MYFLRSKGLLNGLASGTNWVFRDESCHMNFAFEVVEQVRREEPELFDEDLAARVAEMIGEAVDVEYQFAEDLLVPGRPRHVAARHARVPAVRRRPAPGHARLPKRYDSKNPFAFMELQDVQELTNFFERTVSAYQIGVDGEFAMDEDF